MKLRVHFNAMSRKPKNVGRLRLSETLSYSVMEYQGLL